MSHSAHKEKHLFVGNHLTPWWRLTTGRGFLTANQQEFYFGNCAGTACINSRFPAQPERYWIFVDHTCVRVKCLWGKTSIFDSKHRHPLHCLKSFFYESFIVFLYFVFLHFRMIDVACIHSVQYICCCFTGKLLLRGLTTKQRNVIVLDLGVDVLLLPLVVFIYAVHKKTDQLVETEVEIVHLKKYQFECCIIFVFWF